MKPTNRTAFMTCRVDMKFPVGVVDSAVRLLLSVVGRTESKAGCKACNISRDAVESDRLHYSEEWDSEPAFQRHVHSEEFGRVLVAMDMCGEEPQVTIGNLSGHSGIAYLQAIREKPAAGGV
jgi:quinol monooxygenase YgiN